MAHPPQAVGQMSLIDDETAQIRQLKLIQRNLPARGQEFFYRSDTGQTDLRATIHTLSDDDLEYLGF